MAYYPDLSPCDYFGAEHAPRLRAVGWLEPGRPIPQGEVAPAFFRRLCELLVEPWQPSVLMGHHPCGWCRFTGGPGSVRSGAMHVGVGCSNLFVPGDGCLYVAPSLVAHYIDAHGYAPPAEFRDAVLACPPMRSVAYLKRLLADGPVGLVRRSDGGIDVGR